MNEPIKAASAFSQGNALQALECVEETLDLVPLPVERPVDRQDALWGLICASLRPAASQAWCHWRRNIRWKDFVGAAGIPATGQRPNF